MYAELVLSCCMCGEKKEAMHFSPRRERPRGFESRCKACNTKRSLAYHERNRDAILPKMRGRAQRRYKVNPSVAKFWGRTRKEHIKRATPKWADKEAIRKFYMQCPKGMTVDHVIPLKGKNVCGLHVVENFQYLTAQENSRKRCKFSLKN